MSRRSRNASQDSVNLRDGESYENREHTSGSEGSNTTGTSTVPLRGHDSSKTVEVYFNGVRVISGESKKLGEGDRTPIEFKFRGGTAILGIDWKGVCLTSYSADSFQGVEVSWNYETTEVPGYDLTDYSVKIRLEGTGASIPCAKLEYNSSTDDILLKQEDWFQRVG